MPTRLITPSQLSLFSISPMIGAWWQELEDLLGCPVDLTEAENLHPLIRTQILEQALAL